MDNNNDKDYLLSFGIDESGEKTDFTCSIEECMSHALEELEAIEYELSETVTSIKNLTPDCDKIDYALAISSGVLCGLIDVFLVSKPGESPLGNITDKWFAEKTKKFASFCGWKGNEKDPLHSAIRFLENKFKIPFDQIRPDEAASEVFNMTAKNHHFKSLSHNPSLIGLFFAIVDQFTNTSHFVGNGYVVVQESNNGFELVGTNNVSKLFCGFANWIGHLISDNSGSSSSKGRGSGIPSPLWTWTNDVIVIKSKLKLKPTEFDKKLCDFACELFEEGYDARFQSAQAIPVFINELLVRLMYSIRRMIQYISIMKGKEFSLVDFWKYCEPFSNASVKRMLTVARGTFCLIDVGDAVGRGFATGGGSFNVKEFFMRLNIPGLGTFAISIFGETNRGVKIAVLRKKESLLSKDREIVKDHLEGLKVLAEIYDDEELLSFVEDFESSSAYELAFNKTVRLAEKRGVPEDRILRSKKDIDAYFRGGEKDGK